MFYFLSKTISLLFMPVVWVLAVFAYAVFSKKRRKKALYTGIILLLLLTNPFLINFLLLMWEYPLTPLQELKSDYEVGIVLTGITRDDKSPHDRVYLSSGADRIMHALLLYRQGKIKKILITGGTISIFGKEKISEAQNLKNILLQAQVPQEDILIEEKARNTRENALFSKRILESKFQGKKFLLITSAFHMRRALGCFHQVGINPVPFSAGVFTSDLSTVSIGSFMPTERALYYWYIFTHELIGYLVYKTIGYA